MWIVLISEKIDRRDIRTWNHYNTGTAHIFNTRQEAYLECESSINPNRFQYQIIEVLWV